MSTPNPPPPRPSAPAPESSSGTYQRRKFVSKGKPGASRLKLDLFVSHSWRASGAGKWLALNVRMNGFAAATASVLAAGLLAVARRQGLVPACGGYRDEGLDERLEFGVPYALLGGLAAFGGCLFFAHRLGLTQERSAFCDKLCVHQTDPNKKQAAIDSFLGFIGKSKEMVVLWSPGYFTRLWCTFEIASFLHIHRHDASAKLTILPLLLNDVMLASFVCLVVCASTTRSSPAAGPWWAPGADTSTTRTSSPSVRVVCAFPAARGRQGSHSPPATLLFV